MTLRYDNHGRPIGLDWEVCNDGNPQPHIWSNWRPAKKRRRGKKKPVMNPGVGRGGVHKFSKEKDAEFVRLYVEEELPAYLVAERMNSTPKTVWRVLRRNNVQKRTSSTAQKLRYQSRRKAS